MVGFGSNTPGYYIPLYKVFTKKKTRKFKVLENYEEGVETLKPQNKGGN